MTLNQNSATFEDYKANLRQQMEKPQVSDPDLQRIIDKNYRSGAQVGSGSTAAAIRYENATGQPVGGRWHSQKGREAIAQLYKWLNTHPNANPGDIAAAENVILDLRDALGK